MADLRSCDSSVGNLLRTNWQGAAKRVRILRMQIRDGHPEEHGIAVEPRPDSKPSLKHNPSTRKLCICCCEGLGEAPELGAISCIPQGLTVASTSPKSASTTATFLVDHDYFVIITFKIKKLNTSRIVVHCSQHNPLGSNGNGSTFRVPETAGQTVIFSGWLFWMVAKRFAEHTCLRRESNPLCNQSQGMIACQTGQPKVWR